MPNGLYTNRRTPPLDSLRFATLSYWPAKVLCKPLVWVTQQPTHLMP